MGCKALKTLAFWKSHSSFDSKMIADTKAVLFVLVLASEWFAGLLSHPILYWERKRLCWLSVKESRQSPFLFSQEYYFLRKTFETVDCEISSIAAMVSWLIFCLQRSLITSFLWTVEVISGSRWIVSETTPEAVTVFIKVVPSSNTARAILAPVFLFGLNARETIFAAVFQLLEDPHSWIRSLD